MMSSREPRRLGSGVAIALLLSLCLPALGGCVVVSTRKTVNQQGSGSGSSADAAAPRQESGAAYASTYRRLPSEPVLITNAIILEDRKSVV